MPQGKMLESLTLGVIAVSKTWKKLIRDKQRGRAKRMREGYINNCLEKNDLKILIYLSTIYLRGLMCI